MNQATDRIAYRPNEVPAATGISRSAVYEALRAGRLRRVKVGRSTFILADELERFLRSGGQAPTDDLSAEGAA